MMKMKVKHEVYTFGLVSEFTKFVEACSVPIISITEAGGRNDHLLIVVTEEPELEKAPRKPAK